MVSSWSNSTDIAWSMGRQAYIITMAAYAMVLSKQQAISNHHAEAPVHVNYITEYNLSMG